jgi:hypothetical protein
MYILVRVTQHISSNRTALAVFSERAPIYRSFDDIFWDSRKLLSIMPAFPELQFHHVQFCVDDLKPLDEYKNLEKSFNEFSALWEKEGQKLEHGQKVFKQVVGDKAKDPSTFSSINQDIVSQLISAVGLRVTGHHNGTLTHSVLMSSVDATGLKFVVTAPNERGAKKRRTNQSSVVGEEEFDHFDLQHHQQYLESHNGRQGVRVLSFNCVSSGGLDVIAANYAAKHPKLLSFGQVREYGEHDGEKFRILDVAAFYAYKLDGTMTGEADIGTVLRFLEVPSQGKYHSVVLPGLEAVEATFPVTAVACYPDHRVNKNNYRKQNFSTLNDVSGVTPKESLLINLILPIRNNFFLKKCTLSILAG